MDFKGQTFQVAPGQILFQNLDLGGLFDTSGVLGKEFGELPLEARDTALDGLV